MERIILGLLSIYRRSLRFMKYKLCGVQISAIILIGVFFVAGLLHKLVPNNSACFSIVPLTAFSLFLLFHMEVEDKGVSFISKKACTTPKELFKQFTHISFLYGASYFSLSTSSLMVALIASVNTEWVNMVYDYFIYIFIATSFLFSFLFFAYHIYANPTG